MNGTVQKGKISFPKQYRPQIFLGYQKSQTFFDKFRLKKDNVTLSERTQQCWAYTKIVITCATGYIYFY